jgi:hypothetical protein
VRCASEGRLGPGFLLAFTAASALFAGTRESAAFLLAGLLVALLAWLALAAPRARAALGCAAAVLAAVVALSQASTSHSLRWHTPLVNVLLDRIATDPATLAQWQRDYGLPRDTVLARYAAHKAWDASENGVPIRKRLFDDPAFAADQAWLLQRGMSSYRRYLLGPALLPSLADALKALRDYANHPNTGSAGGAGRTPWTERLTAVVYPPLPSASAACLFVVVLGVALAWLRPEVARLGLAAAFLATSAWVQAFVNYHGDSAELPRHLAPAGVLAHLAVLVAALALLRTDQVLRARSPNR